MNWVNSLVVLWSWWEHCKYRPGYYYYYYYYYRCASGCVVECRICNLEVACSNLSLGYFAPRSTQPSIPPGSVNEYQLRLGRQRHGMSHSDCRWTCGCAGKTVKSLENTCHTWALLRWWFTTKRRYVKCMHLYLYYYYYLAACVCVCVSVCGRPTRDGESSVWVWRVSATRSASQSPLPSLFPCTTTSVPCRGSADYWSSRDGDMLLLLLMMMIIVMMTIGINCKCWQLLPPFAATDTYK